ncbi:alcohol oxidase [Wallemia mellicola CBS 633.66]|uniref:Alcohol oxidase n=1 Tax=Wallemia mellicola (strain ATCC MYA-4683 / CBS 633.66) TaxID=671144 RepID=I4YCB7_WALMC|nr:alcohol oxidase [Wallemia mellicola CBS 633.66]EIM21609.1 alcohol oxidase [Wallemia mellicola CBS 633.66]|eukprot:XP_006958304.1 alcohol oxidase [Wallemia mellicola CBS 633.66]
MKFKLYTMKFELCTLLAGIVLSAEAINPDYIVIGGGTTGLALATRLSDKIDSNILVLEAGNSGLGEKIIDLPFGKSPIGSIYDWNYTTEAQINFGLQPVTLPRGRVLGGTSALNGLGWDRPHSREIDAWGNLGNDGWSFNDLLHYMKKSESYRIPPQDILQEYHIESQDQLNQTAIGNDGPLQATISNNVPDYAKRWLPAFEEIGLDVNHSPFDGDNSGASINPSSVNYQNFTRSYSASAYYLPLSYRKNLDVITGAQVVKLIVSDDKITGVVYNKDGENITVSANKEVILSAGAIGTPQILELSGIGRKDILEQNGIEVQIELEGVGENFQDHTAISTIWKLKPGFHSNDRFKYDKEFLQAELQKFEEGDYTSALANVGACLAYVNLDALFSKEEKEWYISGIQEWIDAQQNSTYVPLYKEQLKFVETNAIEHLVANSFVSYNKDRQPESNTSYISVEAAVQHPFSRGSIHIQTSDPYSHPLLLANYFEVESDRLIQTRGLQHIRKLMKTEAMQEIALEEVYPGENVTTDEDLEEYWKTAIRSEHHLIGTASMMPKELNGVVDDELRVYGLSNLRIADASIIPLHVSAHIQATLYGIAEKAADLILNSN